METKSKIKRILTLIIAFITILLIQTNVKAAVDYGDYAHAGGESIAQSVEDLKAGLGQKTTWTNHTVPGNTNDYKYGVQKYTSLQCADYSSTNYSQIPKLYGVIDINRTFNQKNNNMYTTAELWTPGSSYTYKSTEMAYLSYIAWASGVGKYSSNPTTWNSHWYSEYKKMDAICAGRVHSWTSEWRTGGSLIRNAANDANYYANFVKNIGEDGKVISNDKNKEGQRVSAGEAQITFDKFLIDENYNKTTEQGLGQAIGVYVTAQNGATAGFYVNKEGVHNKTGSGLSINGKKIENITIEDLKSLNWTVSWDDPSINASNPMVQIKVDTSFYSYHGVIAMMYPETQGKAQGRVLTGGECARLQQEVIFTLDGGTKIIVEKKWSGYKQDPNFVMPNSIDFIIYANVSGVEIEYARGTVYNNGSDVWDPYELEIESLEMNGDKIVGFRVEEVDLGLGEGWTTIVTETSPNHWVIVNNYKKQAKVPLLELNKVNEVGRELKDAKLKVTIDDYYTNSFATTTKDPDITITFSDVLSRDIKMRQDFEAQNAVELFNYSRNKRNEGPVGDLATNAGNIYLDLRDILYNRLMADLQSDPDYQEDVAHAAAATTHPHGTDSNGNTIYDDYCGYMGHCGIACCIAAGNRVAAADKAVHDYVYGGTTFTVGLYTEKEQTRAVSEEKAKDDGKKTLFGGDTIMVGNKVYTLEVEIQGEGANKTFDQSLKEYATLNENDIVNINGYNYKYILERKYDETTGQLTVTPRYIPYNIRPGETVKKDDQNYFVENDLHLTKFSDKYNLYKNNDVILIGTQYYKMNISGSNVSLTQTSLTPGADYYNNSNGILYRWNPITLQYVPQTPERTQIPLVHGDVIVDGDNSYKVTIDSNGVMKIDKYTPEVIDEDRIETIKPNYVLEGGKRQDQNPGELIETDPNCTMQMIKGISPDDMLRDLYEKADDYCEVPYYHSPLHADFAFSVWYMYENYQSTCVHLNDLAAIYTTKHDNSYDLSNFDKEMHIKLEEEVAPRDYLKWAHDNDKHLYLTWQLGKVTAYHYDADDNDSRELEYINKKSTQTKLAGAITESCENGIDWTLVSIKAWDAKVEDIIQFTKYAELANGNSSTTKPMDGVTFTIKIETQERLDGKGIAQGGLKPEEWTVTKTTDKNGYIGITTKELQDNLKIDVISRWIGTIKVTYTEVDLGKYTPYYEKWFTPRSVEYEFTGSEHGVSNATVKGEVEGPGEDAIVNSTNGYHILTAGYDTPSWAPQMIIKKTDMAGNALAGAEFDVTIRSDRGGSVQLGKCITNKAGEFMIYPSDLRGLGITTMNRWTGDLTLIARETKAPGNYTNLNENRDIIATIHFEHGQIVPNGTSVNQGNHVEWSIHNTWYEDEQTWEGSSPTFVLSVKNSLDNNLRIRKVEANTEKQDYLDDKYLAEAEFDVTIKNGNNRETRKAKLDSKGYFMLRDDNGGYTMSVTELADRVAGSNYAKDLGQFTGTLEVSIKETKTPSGYVEIKDTMTVYLEYERGYYQGAKYKDNVSGVLLDVGKSEDRTTVTITVKNTKQNLQPIYIQKIDGATNTSVPGVAFDITISKTAIREQDSIKTNTYTTGNEGMIAIETSELNKIGINNNYSGDLYVLIEEVDKQDGYTMLEGPVYVHVTYKNGNIENATILSGDGNTTWIDKNGIGMLKITVNNPWEIPDIEIEKRTLTNGEIFLIDDATFYVELSANGNRRYSKESKVSESGKIVFDSATLKKELGVDGTYTGDIEVYISEIDVRDDAAIVDEAFTITLTYKNGRLVSSDIENKTHASVITSNDGSKVTITVNDSIIIPEHIFLGGYVWEEKATTKDGLEIDGIYTQMSDSEHTDLMLTGIEATLYKKESDGTLKFVDNVAGTNPTLTDENGYYEFEVPKGPQYVVKFTYNGQAFEDAAVDTNSQIYSKDWSSKGTEISNGLEARNYINDLYKEIGSYPANYKVGNFAFNGTEAREHFALASNGDIYNISYRNTEIGEVRDRVAIETNNYLGEHKYINKDKDRTEINKAYADIYRNVIKNYYTENGQLTDKEIYNKLQFIHDSRISAVAGDKTESYELTTFANLATYSDTYKYINLGIVKRDMVDLTLIKDAYSATVSINRKDTIYDYNKDIDKYTLLNYEEDYNYNTKANSNGLAYYNAGEDEVELYSTYRVRVTNEKNINTQLTEIVDYFDSKFGYKDEYTTSSGAKIKGIRAYKLDAKGNRIAELTDNLDTSRNGTKGTSTTGRYIDASRIGLIGNPYLTNNKTVNPDYSELFVTFAEGKEPSLKMGESVEFYITIKLGKGEEQIDREGSKKAAENYLIAPKYNNNKDRAMDILKQAINDPKNLKKVMDIYNYTEINGYKTIDEQGNPKGYFDDDSKPGTFIVKDFEDIMDEYYKAWETLQKNPTPENRDKFTKMLDQVNKMREDDTWAVELDVMNNLNDSQNEYYHRSVNGNVWEAVTNEVKTSTDLYNDKLLTYIKEKGIQGIAVELVELEPDGDQIVRAKTVTDKDGKYEFRGFIPGDYTVRFVYGAEKREGYEDEQNKAMNNTSRNGYNDIAKNRGVNGQYYQSTKANPNTNAVEYWYAKEPNTRYSDAYDEVTARIEQIESQTNNDKTRNSDNKSITNVDNSWSWDYEWDGVFNAQTRRHIDQMEAYTSTMQFEVENTKVQLEGIMDAPVNASFKAYRYQINNIDFGLTPRAEADLNIDKYVSNIKVYLADNTDNANGTLQLDVDFLANGSVQKYNNNALFNNIVIPTPGENNTAYRDGLLEVLYDTQLLNGATIEVTYTITVSNDGQANTITYYYDGNEIAANGGRITEKLSPIAHSYYNGHGEDLSKLTVFESDRNIAKIKLDVDNEKTFEGIKYNPTTVFNGDYGTNTSKTNTYKKTNYTKISNGSEKETTNTIMKHNVKDNNARKINNDTNTYGIKEAAADKAVFVDVKTRATNIVDYIDPNLNFTQTNMKGETINLDWELTDVSKFNSTREGYKGTGVATDVMTKYNNIVRAVGGDTYTRYLSYLAAVANGVEDMVWTRDDTNRPNYSSLYTPLTTKHDVDKKERENTATTTLTLSKVLQTSSTETNDYEYSNLIELTRMENYAGKIIDIENYDITGENNPETSEVGDLSNVPENDVTKLEPPTMGTSKSETIVIHEPTGLSMQDAPKANLGIVLIVLVILSGGIILIKKFVLTPKND